ncbi:hypothetical protein HDU85_003692 [Gaertneriomyces sp. JEL0708]|nr:hypothetical protein HDU85_003692 [Gaertneriomyces sp. JEL0708]
MPATFKRSFSGAERVKWMWDHLRPLSHSADAREKRFLRPLMHVLSLVDAAFQNVDESAQFPFTAVLENNYALSLEKYDGSEQLLRGEIQDSFRTTFDADYLSVWYLEPGSIKVVMSSAVRLLYNYRTVPRSEGKIHVSEWVLSRVEVHIPQPDLTSSFPLELSEAIDYIQSQALLGAGRFDNRVPLHSHGQISTSPNSTEIFPVDMILGGGRLEKGGDSEPVSSAAMEPQHLEQLELQEHEPPQVDNSRDESKSSDKGSDWQIESERELKDSGHEAHIHIEHDWWPTDEEIQEEMNIIAALRGNWTSGTDADREESFGELVALIQEHQGLEGDGGQFEDEELPDCLCNYGN